MRAAGTPARREAPHEALIRGGGWHKAEVTPAHCEAPHEALRGAGCFTSGVSTLPRRRRGEGGCTKAGRSRAGDGALRGRLRMRGRVRGRREPGDQGVNVAQAKTRGEGVHKGWAR